jgi:hypothetical protein
MLARNIHRARKEQGRSICLWKERLTTVGDTVLGGKDVAGVALELNVVVGELAELAVIKTHLLLLGADAKAKTGDEVHDEQDDAGHDEGVRETRHAVSELVSELDPVVVDPTTGDDGNAIESGYVVTEIETC